jgi:hypothetical protein
VISVDAKKRKLIGDFKAVGREFGPKGKPVEVRGHDFKDSIISSSRPACSTSLTIKVPPGPAISCSVDPPVDLLQVRGDDPALRSARTAGASGGLRGRLSSEQSRYWRASSLMRF